MDNRSFFERRVDGAQRLLMCNFLPKILPLYIVTEYPKSGGSWVSQMLSDYLGIPFPRNKRPKFESSIMHGHYSYNPLLKNVFCVVRDGRDVMVSAYYHIFHQSDIFPPEVYELYRKRCPFDDYQAIEANLPKFIEYMFTIENKKIMHSNWKEFNQSWLDKSAQLIKYEDLLIDAPTILAEAIQQTTQSKIDLERLTKIVDKYSFENQTKRKRGEEITSSFLRKGIAGDWKNKFTPEAKQVFNYYAGDMLIRLGYEKNNDWAN